MSLTVAQWKERQHRLNLFTETYLKGVGKIPEDGKTGVLTRRRILECQWWLGWEKRTGHWSDRFHQALLAPKDSKITSAGTVRRGNQRRRQHNLNWVNSHLRTGIRTYDGVRVAAWIVPYLDWARNVGVDGKRWRGRLVSGYRDPAYSERLCYARCGRPSCPGTCAGRASAHSGKVKPAGAIDVSDFLRFAELMQHCPIQPHLRNDLPKDKVHFSINGH